MSRRVEAWPEQCEHAMPPCPELADLLPDRPLRCALPVTHHWQDPPERRRHHAKGRVAAPATGGFGLEVVVAWVDGQVEALTWTALRQPATPLLAVAAGQRQ